MLIWRCPRCRAEDISADAHPARRLAGGTSTVVMVCRGCYRAAELEFRIACDGAGIPYEALPIREGLRLLRDFYLDRLAQWQDPELLVEDPDRRAGSEPILRALAEVDARLRIAPLDEASRLDS